MTHVKICGITNVADARCAATAGSDMLGFIFYPPSARYITPLRAGEIIATLRGELGATAPRMVGVFVDAPTDELVEATNDAGLDLLQLHGAESAEMIRALHEHVHPALAFKAVRSRTLLEAQEAMHAYCDGQNGNGDETVPCLLIDAYHPEAYGGTGLRADAATAQWLSRRCQLLLAGGLTPENVSDTIRLVRPWGVDVSSGVEITKGIKNHTLVRDFIAAVRHADRGPAHPTQWSTL